MLQKSFCTQSIPLAETERPERHQPDEADPLGVEMCYNEELIRTF